MKGLFPLRSEPELGDRNPKLVDMADDEAEEVFDALGSDTARTILLELHDEPRPASELATAVDTSVQNVQYHLTKLAAADLVSEVDTWYSESGTEMVVYAPADEALVLFAGEDREGALRRLLRRFVGVLTVLAGVSILLFVGLERWEPWTRSQNPSVGSPNASVGMEPAGIDPLLVAAVFFCGGVLAVASFAILDRLLR